MGVLGWPPHVFWDALLTQTLIAVEGVALANGADMPDEASERRAALLDELEKLKAQYPDG